MCRFLAICMCVWMSCAMCGTKNMAKSSSIRAIGRKESLSCRHNVSNDLLLCNIICSAVVQASSALSRSNTNAWLNFRHKISQQHKHGANNTPTKCDNRNVSYALVDVLVYCVSLRLPFRRVGISFYFSASAPLSSLRGFKNVWPDSSISITLPFPNQKTCFEFTITHSFQMSRPQKASHRIFIRMLEFPANEQDFRHLFFHCNHLLGIICQILICISCQIMSIEQQHQCFNGILPSSGTVKSFLHIWHSKAYAFPSLSQMVASDSFV